MTIKAIGRKLVAGAVVEIRVRLRGAMWGKCKHACCMMMVESIWALKSKSAEAKPYRINALVFVDCSST